MGVIFTLVVGGYDALHEPEPRTRAQEHGLSVGPARGAFRAVAVPIEIWSLVHTAHFPQEFMNIPGLLSGPLTAMPPQRFPKRGCL